VVVVSLFRGEYEFTEAMIVNMCVCFDVFSLLRACSETYNFLIIYVFEVV
jgi:hypothetical protein